MGARQAITENQTTGRFLGHDYTLPRWSCRRTATWSPRSRTRSPAAERLFILDLHADQILALADLPEAADAVLFNTRAPDDRLRLDDCRANLFHVMPSRAMKADALAQYLVWKRWRELVPDPRHAGARPARSPPRSSARPPSSAPRSWKRREYEYVSTARRTDSGHIQIQSQIPVLTQDAPEHDVVVVADESDVFGEYLPYRTWDPRPVAGHPGPDRRARGTARRNSGARPRCSAGSRSSPAAG